MNRFGLPRLAALCLAAFLTVVVSASTARAQTLAAERKSQFFTWFNLTPSCEPTAAGPGRTWQCFRPSGPQFRPLVEVAVMTDAADTLLERRIGIDRVFIDDRRNGVFARDIAKSFLQWSLAAPVSSELATLIQHIANVAASGAPVITREGTSTPPAGPDTTGGYAVFLGRAGRVALTDGPNGLTMVNLPGRLPNGIHEAGSAAPTPAPPADAARWLLIDVKAARR